MTCPTKECFVYEYNITDPQLNYLSLIGDFSADSIIQQIQTEIDKRKQSILDYRKQTYRAINHQAANTINTTRLKNYETQLVLAKQKKTELDEQAKRQNIIDVKNLQFQKSLADSARINLVNLSADQTRISENTKKFLALGILGAAVLG